MSAGYGRIWALLIARFFRNLLARLTWNLFALRRMWPGTPDQITIAPPELRTADATRAATSGAR